MKTKVLEIMDLKVTVYNQNSNIYQLQLSNKQLAGKFSNFFAEKKDNIRAIIDAQEYEHKEPEPYNQNISSSRGPE